MKLILTCAVMGLMLAAGQAARAAEALAIELPAGGQVRVGDYFPVVVLLHEPGPAGGTEVHLTVGKLTFFKQVEMSSGASRRVLLLAAALQEHPDIALTLRCAGREARYPDLARKLSRELKLLAPREHLVGILSDGPNPELAQLFHHAGITRVELSPGLEFPAQVLPVFDMIAFDALLWQSMGPRMNKALEAYVNSGGGIYMSNHEIPPPAPEAHKIVRRVPQGLGSLYLLNPRYRPSRILEVRRLEVKEKVLLELKMAQPRRFAAERRQVSAVFAPLPRHLNARGRWAAYLLVCTLALTAAVLCAYLRLWARRTAQMLMPGLAACLTLGFLTVAPGGSVAYERVSLILGAADSSGTVQRSYVHLYSFADCGRATYELGADGLILPVVSGWRAWREFAPVLHNGDGAKVSGLSLKKGSAAIFELTQRAQSEGTFHVSGRAPARITNNTGLDIDGCVLVRSGMVGEMGEIPFGRTAVLERGCNEYIQEYLTRRFGGRDRSAGMKAAFTQYAWKRFMRPGRTYLSGWAAPHAPLPPGYAQATDLGTMWIIEIP